MEAFMRAVVGGLVLLLTLSAQSADDPRSIVDKAIQARGGEKQLAQAAIVQLKVRGRIFREQATYPFVATISSQLPDRYKHVMDYQKNGETVTQLQIYSGKNVWLRVRDELQNLDAQLSDAL